MLTIFFTETVETIFYREADSINSTDEFVGHSGLIFR